MIRPSKNPTRRRAIGALEVLLVLPVLLLVILAAVEFSSILTAEDKLAEASRQGARVAATNGDEDAVKRAVEESLQEKGYRNATTTIRYIDADSSRPGTSVAVEVTVSVPGDQVAPNYLRAIGFDNREPLVGRTVMRLEVNR